MVHTMNIHGGSGLAAPQVGEFLRLFVVRDLSNQIPPDADERHGLADESLIARHLGVRPSVVINPRVLHHSEDEDVDWESCLSIPELHGRVPRPSVVDVEYTSLEGEKQEARLDGYAARVFQHELDHLEGVLFLDRVVDGLNGLVHTGELHHHV